MRNKTNHQIIWKRKGTDHSGLVLDMPTIINSDVGFQLVFGMPEDTRQNRQREQEHHITCAKQTNTISLNELKITWI